MNPLERRVLLLRAGLTQAEIARAYGCSRQHVGQVIWGSSRNPEMRRYIARRLGMRVAQIWPESRRAKRLAA